MSSGRVSFSPEFREQMVELFLSYKGQKNLSQVARENGIGAETLRNWVKKYGGSSNLSGHAGRSR